MADIKDPEDPRLLRIHADRLIRRDIDGLLGICEFALQDGHIDQGEAESILAWLNAHQECLNAWPANILFDRLRIVLADGNLDDNEQRDLLGLIMEIARPRNQAGEIHPSTLPLNDPVPELIFEGRTFCFTGVFDFGQRSLCQEATIQRGGVASNSVTKKLNYLVIGNVGSEVWRHSSFGAKIVKAVEYREAGTKIAIISENYWANHFK